MISMVGAYGSKGGNATMAKVFNLREKLRMDYKSFNDHEHSGMPSNELDEALFCWLNTEWFQTRGKTPPAAIHRNYEKLRLWSAKCQFKIVPKQVIITDPEAMEAITKFITYDPRATGAGQDDLFLE